MQTPEDSFWSVLGRVQVRIDFNSNRNDYNIDPYEHICRLQRTASGVCWGERDDDRLRRNIRRFTLIASAGVYFLLIIRRSSSSHDAVEFTLWR